MEKASENYLSEENSIQKNKEQGVGGSKKGIFREAKNEVERKYKRRSARMEVLYPLNVTSQQTSALFQHSREGGDCTYN